MVSVKPPELIAKTVAAVVILGFDMAIFGWGLVGCAYVISTKVKFIDIIFVLFLTAIWYFFAAVAILLFLSGSQKKANLLNARNLLFNILIGGSGLYLLAVPTMACYQGRLQIGMDPLIALSIVGLMCMVQSVMQINQLIKDIRSERKLQALLLKPPKLPDYIRKSPGGPPPLPKRDNRFEKFSSVLCRERRHSAAHQIRNQSLQFSIKFYTDTRFLRQMAADAGWSFATSSRL